MPQEADYNSYNYPNDMFHWVANLYKQKQNMKQIIKSEVVAHSVSPQGEELISILGTFPRFILAEVNTHRMLSKNTSSSRAIPFAKMLQTIQEDPFIPIAWQKDHKGMQGTEYFTETEDIKSAEGEWLKAGNLSVQQAIWLSNGIGVTKQLCNRLLEPFMWTTMLITGSRSGWENFFHLRCPQYQTPVSQTVEPQRSWKDLMDVHSNPINEDLLEKNADNWLFKLQHNKGQAEIHMMAFAEAVWDSVNESTPKQLQAGEWHIPFEDKIQRFANIPLNGQTSNEELEANILMNKVKVSVAMAARTSYTIVGEEKSIDSEALLGLHDRLTSQNPPHSSPFEHVAQCMSEDEYFSYVKGVVSVGRESDSSIFNHEYYAWIPQDNYHMGFAGLNPNNGDRYGWCNNLKGFIPYRYFIDNSLPL